MPPPSSPARAIFQSTLPARGATASIQQVSVIICISIHAPRTGSDRGALRWVTTACYFNPRSPHGERPLTRSAVASKSRFQSTLPARGATSLPRAEGSIKIISIHAPRTGSDLVVAAHQPLHVISIHAPRTGSDLRAGRGVLPGAHISIHAPRTGSDRLVQSSLWSADRHFNPRSPHGERRRLSAKAPARRHFNPRSPHGERQRKVTILSIRIIGFAQKVYHKTVLLRISLAENAVILPKRPQNPVRTSLQKAGGLRFARAIRAARPYSISSPSGA